MQIVKTRSFLQDPYVGPAVERDMDQAKIGADMSNDRVRIQDTRDLFRPDQAGNYLPEPNSDGAAQLNAHVVTTSTLDMWQNYHGSPIAWGFGDPVLEVIPHKKQGMNAYYSRWEASTNYFFQDSPQLATTVKTAQSLDVVAHETGHAILDGLKPGYLGTSDKETGAFHEAFGDCTAMLMTLQDPIMNERLIEETGGDLRKENHLAHMAEEFGKARRLANSDPSDDDREWLRNGINNFTYVRPETLGDGRGDDYTLGGEIHSFSRLFTGAFYDCLEATYKQACEQLPPALALKSAADTLGPIFGKAVERASASRGKFRDIALQMIRVSEGPLSQAFSKIFLDRKIIRESDLQTQPEPPRLMVDHDFASPQEAAAFVNRQAKVLNLPPNLDYHDVTISRNAKGEQVLNLLYSQDVPAYDGLVTDVNGGVTLAFDARGRLEHFQHSPIDEQAIREEIEGLQAHDHDHLIWRSGPMDAQPYKAAIQGNRIVKIPTA